MSWRPDGWKNQYLETIKKWEERARQLDSPYPFELPIEEKLANVFEEGADAMLETIRKHPLDLEIIAESIKYGESQGFKASGHQVTFFGILGKLVFIPDVP